MWTWSLLALLALGLAAVWGSRAWIACSARGRTFDSAADVPFRETGLVLGCVERLADGRPNLFFRYRVEAAAALYRAGKVRYLIVSGDNHRRGYDEPTDLKAALVRAGVPADSIYCDYAGFRTLDSVVRARAVFSQARVTVISQRFHNERAIFIARARGLDAIGFNACEVSGRHSLRTRLREQLARVRTVLDVRVFRTQPRFLGPPVPVDGSPQA